MGLTCVEPADLPGEVREQLIALYVEGIGRRLDYFRASRARRRVSMARPINSSCVGSSAGSRTK